MASCRSVWLAPPDRREVRTRHPSAGPALRAGQGQAEMRHALPRSLAPGDLCPCRARAGPGPYALPTLRHARPGASSRSWGHGHGPAAAVPAGLARGARGGRSRLTCGSTAGLLQADNGAGAWGGGAGGPWWAHIASVAAWHGLGSLPASAFAPAAALVHASPGCARAEAYAACAFGGSTTPGEGARRARLRTSSRVTTLVRGGVGRR